MKTDFKAFKKDMQILKDRSDKVNKIVNQFDDLFGGFDGIVVNTFFTFIHDLIVFIQEKYNADDWIEWYIYENDFEKEKREASRGLKKMKKIKNVKDLWELIK